MIKLIVSDMDGTLLNADKQLPRDFFKTLHKLSEMDIHFAIASGRSYITLRENLEPAGDSISYICDNGSLLISGGNTIHKSTLSMAQVLPILDVCNNIDDIKIILCGCNGTYHLDFDWEINGYIKNYYKNQCIVNDMSKIEDDIFKLTIYDTNNPKIHTEPIINSHFKDIYSVQTSGSVWLDIMPKDVNKGTTLSKLQSHLRISENETMSFGDYFNDIEMLKKSKYSFAMENSLQDIKDCAKYVCRSNNDDGVIRKIYDMIFNLPYPGD